jgi:transcription elongation GreA/GreB family factor
MANTDVLADAARQSDDIEPTPVHRAIDSLAAVGIEVQLLRRKRQRGETIESAELDEAISRIEPQLDGLAVILASLRDQSPL